jgi:hypothetical protein
MQGCVSAFQFFQHFPCVSVSVKKCICTLVVLKKKCHVHGVYIYMDYTCHVYGYIYLHTQHQLTPTYFYMHFFDLLKPIYYLPTYLFIFK